METLRWITTIVSGQGVSLHVILKLHYGSALMYGVPLHSYESGAVSILHI